MFCAKCGAKNRDDAGHCVICKASLPAADGHSLPSEPSNPQASPQPPQPTPPVLAADPHAHVPNHLVPALIATVLCCLPAGVVAIVYSLQVETKLQLGDREAAQRASNNAKVWCWVAVGGFFAAIIFWLLIVVIVAAAEAM